MNDINHPTYKKLNLNHSLNQNQISKKSHIYNMTYLHFLLVQSLDLQQSVLL